MQASTSGPEQTKDRCFFTALLAILLIAFIALCWPHLARGGGYRLAYGSAARSLLSQLAQAAAAYELDYAVYPVGDGTGSAPLARALQFQRTHYKHNVYAEPPPLELLKSGDIRSPLGEDKLVYYRCPGIRNPKSFDLWCEDAEGRPDGINNWAASSSGP
jgi:hypothetical protein